MQSTSWCALHIVIFVSFAQSVSGQSDARSLPSFAEPAISPDNAEIAFVSGGDIWTVPAVSGEARLLVSHPANESRPVYSPDGRRLAFTSTRTIAPATPRPETQPTPQPSPQTSEPSTQPSPAPTATPAANPEASNKPAPKAVEIVFDDIRRRLNLLPVGVDVSYQAVSPDGKWVEDNRAYVSRISGNRLGYVHLFDMSAASLAQLYVDLDAENHLREGVVIDLRNNNGGFVNVYAIDVFARRGYLTMTPRGLVSAPARTALGQRALELPTILVTNQHSLSDAEDFTEGYRTLRLGKVIGEPTAGWIIYTWNTRLVDGSAFRLPRMKVTANDNTNMELNPRPVDMEVTRPVGETYLNRDAQLDAAVRELTTQIGGARR